MELSTADVSWRVLQHRVAAGERARTIFGACGLAGLGQLHMAGCSAQALDCALQPPFFDLLSAWHGSWQDMHVSGQRLVHSQLHDVRLSILAPHRCAHVY